MDSPVRKQLKRNDYLRHKMFRKINRRKKAEQQLAIDAPAKELRRRLRRKRLQSYENGKDSYSEAKSITKGLKRRLVYENGNSLPKFDEADKDVYDYAKELDNLYVDEYGNVLDPENPSAKGSILLPEVTISKRDPRKPVPTAYHPEDIPAFFNILTGNVLGRLSPSQTGRAIYDTFDSDLSTQDKLNSWFIGNPGVVSKLFEQEHPYWSMAANMATDAAVLGGGMSLLRKPSVGRVEIPQTAATRSEIPAVETALQVVAEQPYLVQRYPGYMLKSLMEGNPLEKQLSKSGTISTNSIKAQIAKASNVEKDVVDKVLSSEQFAGLKAIDYNQFRKAVLDKLIGSYNRVPQAEYNDYGVDRLGYKTDRHIWEMDQDPNIRIEDGLPVHAETGIPLTQEERAAWINLDLPRLNTFTFESPHIPYGNTKHYYGNPIGHSRTYTLPEEPDVLHVMESQSDWAQEGTIRRALKRANQANERLDRINKQLDDWRNALNTGTSPNGEPLEEWGRRQIELEFIPKLLSQQWKYKGISEIEANKVNEQALYLSDNYINRQIQENLKYAAESGLTKMRYPTSETAAKIEGYRKGFTRTDETEAIRKQISDTQKELNEAILEVDDPFDSESWINRRVEELDKQLKSLRERFDDALMRSPRDYSPQHKTILKKYSDFPKQFKKLWKNQDVRTVTDEKGNSWYEVDVPENFLNREWMYDEGKDELPYPLRTSIDYDDNLAYQAGIVRDSKGHMMTTTQEKYPNRRTYLKKPIHPTFSLGVWGDKTGGYDVFFQNGLTYSAPGFSELWRLKTPISPLSGIKVPFKYDKGKSSGIHIKPENRGKFTALKKRTGKSASWFKAHGTPALKKMATFALNSRKFKH